MSSYCIQPSSNSPATSDGDDVPLDLSIRYELPKIPYSLSLMLDMPPPRRPPQLINCSTQLLEISQGLHVWTITWKVSIRRFNPMIGVATQVALQQNIGATKDSWGWDLNLNQLHHDNHREIYPNLVRHESMRNDRKPSPNLVNINDLFGQSNSTTMVLDMDAGTLSFMADGKYLGKAFDGLTGLTLSPVISTAGYVQPGDEPFTVVYVGSASTRSKLK